MSRFYGSLSIQLIITDKIEQHRVTDVKSSVIKHFVEHVRNMWIPVLSHKQTVKILNNWFSVVQKSTKTSGYATWFTAGGAIRIAHYDVIDDVITRKL